MSRTPPIDWPDPLESDPQNVYLDAHVRDQRIVEADHLDRVLGPMKAVVSKTEPGPPQPPGEPEPTELEKRAAESQAMGGPGLVAEQGLTAEDVKKGRSEVLGGIAEIPKGIALGPVSAVAHTMGAFNDLLTWTAGQFGNENELDKPLSELSNYLAGIGKPKTAIGGFVRDTSEFLTSFIPVMRALQGTSFFIRAVEAAPVLTQGAIGVTAGLPAGFLSIDSAEQAYAEWREKAPPEVQTTMEEWIANEDPKAEKRLGKRAESALMSAGLGVLAEGAFAAGRAFKSWRIARRALARTQEAQTAAEAKAAGAKPPPAPPDLNEVAFGPADAPAFRLVGPESMGAEAGVPTFSAPFHQQLAQQRAEQAEARIRAAFGKDAFPDDEIKRLAAMDEVELDLSGSLRSTNSEEDVERLIVDITKAFRSRVEVARRATVKPAKEGFAPRSTMTDDTLRRLAGESDFDVERMLARHRGRPFSAEEVLISKRIMGSAATLVRDLARSARGPQASDTTRLALMKSIALLQALDESFMGGRAEVGRALRAFGLDVTPGRKQEQQLVNLLVSMGGKKRVEDIADALARLDEAGVPEGGIIAATKTAAKAPRSKIVGLFEEIIANGFLWRPRTHTANTVGSMVFLQRQIIERKAAEIGARALGDISEEGSVVLGEAAAMNSAFWSSMRQASAIMYRANLAAIRERGVFGSIRNPGAIIEEGLERAGSTAEIRGLPPELRGPTSSRAEEAGRIRDITAARYGLDPESNAGLFIDFVGATNRIPSRLLGQEDLWAKMIAYDVEMASQAWRQASREHALPEAIEARFRDLIKNPTPELKFEAARFAEFTTLTNRSKAVQQVLNLRDVSDRWIGKIPAFMIFTFLRTPLNALARDLDRTPLGLLGGQSRADLEAGGARAQIAAARIALGTMFSLSLLDYAMNGGITGSMTGLNQTLRESRLRDRVQPNSIKIGGLWFDLRRLDPALGFPALVAGNFAEMVQKKEIDSGDTADFVEMWASIGLATGRATLDKASLSGFGLLMDLIETQRIEGLEKGSGAAYIGRVAESLIPMHTLFRSAEEFFDPALQDPTGVWQQIMSGIPILSGYLPDKRDAYGFKLSAEDQVMPYLDDINQFSPAKMNRARNSLIENELQNNGVPFTKLRKDQHFKDPKTGLPVEISMHDKGHAFEALASLAGHALKFKTSQVLPAKFRGPDTPKEVGLYELHNSLIRSRGYAELNAIPEFGQRAKMLDDYIQTYRAEAERVLLTEDLEKIDAMLEGEGFEPIRLHNEIVQLRREVSIQGQQRVDQMKREQRTPSIVPTPDRGGAPDYSDVPVLTGR